MQWEVNSPHPLIKLYAGHDSRGLDAKLPTPSGNTHHQPFSIFTYWQFILNLSKHVSPL